MRRPAHAVACLCVLAILMAGLWFLAAGSTHAGAAEEKTYIEFIFDASGSMKEKVDGGKTRIEVAKEVIKELVESLEDRPDMEIALRVYGSMLPGKPSCQDSGLLQPFGPVGKVRAAILKIVASLNPGGMTPITYSLEEAAKDFPKAGRKVIVLVTDGEESCGANPCITSRKLQDAGLILKPYVVGFGLSAAAEEKVKCIGNYYSAKDRAGLSAALKSIVVEVVSPPLLEVEAWAGETNVTARTNIEVLDADGKPVKATPQGPAGQVLKLALPAEGVYAVKGTLTVEGETLSASQPNVTLKKGETTKVRLDFAGLPGKIVLVARMGDRVVPASSLKASAYSEEKGRKDFGVQGDRMAVAVAPGKYSVQCTYTGDPQQNRTVENVEVKAGETKEVAVTFDQPGKLRLKVLVDNKPSNEARVSVHQNQKLYRTLSPLPGERGVFECGVLEGAYDIQVTPSVAGFTEQWVRDVKVKAGQTVEKQVAFNPSKIRVKVTAEGKPFFVEDMRLMLYEHDPEKRDSQVGSEEYVCDIEMVEKGLFEVKIKEGVYDLLAVNLGTGYADKTIRKLEIKPGETLEKSLEIGGMGKVTVKVTSGGKPYSVGGMRLMLYEHDPEKRDSQVGSEEYVCDIEMVEKGLFEVKIKEGVYDLLAVNLGTGYADKTIRKLEIKPGETLEKSLEIGGMGRIIVKVTSGGKPYSSEDMGLSLYEYDPENRDVGSEEWVCHLEEVEKGLFEAKVKEGVYDLLAYNLGEGFQDRSLRQLEIQGGGTLEKSINLGGIGKLRLRVTWDGKACTDEDVRLMVNFAGTDDYVCDLEMVREGVFEAKLAEGEYDVEITDGFSSQWVRGLVVTSGGTLEQDVEITLEK
ncbi:MAG: VWA domain-containing protein [Bacillota bacterium]|nr:VWA domain-containing protein [Bacillota bacterium]